MVAHIPKKFYNIVAGDSTLLSHTSRVEETYRVTPRFYRPPESLLVEIIKATQLWKFDSRSVASLMSMRYDKTTNKVKIKIVRDMKVTFGNDLCRALGLAQGPHVSETHHVPRLCNMFLGLSYLFVYANLVRGRLVGDTQSPLLRAITVHANYGGTTHEFRQIHYTEAAAFNSDVVEVNVRTKTGELTPFVDGKVLLTLHLRQQEGDGLGDFLAAVNPALKGFAKQAGKNGG